MEMAPESLIPNVMKTLESETTLETQKPLIPTFGWIFIAGVLTALSLLALQMGEGEEGTGYLDPFYQWISNLQLASPDFSSLPETAWMGALAFGVYGILQLIWMKREIDRQQLF